MGFIDRCMAIHIVIWSSWPRNILWFQCNFTFLLPYWWAVGCFKFIWGFFVFFFFTGLWWAPMCLDAFICIYFGLPITLFKGDIHRCATFNCHMTSGYRPEHSGVPCSFAHPFPRSTNFYWAVLYLCYALITVVPSTDQPIVGLSSWNLRGQTGEPPSILCFR